MARILSPTQYTSSPVSAEGHATRAKRLVLMPILVASEAGPAAGQTVRYGHRRAFMLNDLRAAPGAVRTADMQVVCSTSTGAVRHVTARMKRQVCGDYGVRSERCNGRFAEIDLWFAKIAFA